MPKPPIRLPGPINDIVEELGSPANAVSLLKKGTKVASEKLREMNADFAEADQVVKGIKIGRKRQR
jgi:hypothetical protein